MAQDRNQIHYRVDTLMKYYGIKDEEKLLRYLKAQGFKAESEENKWVVIV
jgi:hypothetical protein